MLLVLLECNHRCSVTGLDAWARRVSLMPDCDIRDELPSYAD